MVVLQGVSAINKSADEGIDYPVVAPEELVPLVEFSATENAAYSDATRVSGITVEQEGAVFEMEVTEEVTKQSIDIPAIVGSAIVSLGFFGLALLCLGLAISFLGFLSLSLERRLEGIGADDLFDQIRAIRFSSAVRNVSINWRAKTDGRLFVLIGLCSIVAAALYGLI